MSKLRTFRMGGIHPDERKELSLAMPLERIPEPEILHVPVNQHIGAPCKVLVNAGDRVLKNQLLAETESGLGSAVHSPVSGQVVEIKEMVFPGKKKNNVIVIKNDNQHEKAEGTAEHREPEQSFDAFIEIVRKNGIIGMGGAGFPTYCKLNPPKDKMCDMFIVNAAECEPYLNADYRAMMEYGEKFVKAVSYILDVTGMKRAIIGIESNKPDALKKLSELNNDGRITVQGLKTKYPQGAEKQLIYALTKRIVPIRKLPFEVGVIVQNVGTVLAIYDAVYRNQPLTERILTVSGMGIGEPKNVIAAVGTPIEKVIEFCGGLNNARYAINGGPMMGKAFDDMALPVTKTTSGLLFLTENECEEAQERECIRCSKCLHVCPMGLNPTFLMDVSKKRKYDDMDDVLDCIECGSCTYICPSNRSLAESIIKGKEKYAKYLKRSKKND